MYGLGRLRTAAATAPDEAGLYLAPPSSALNVPLHYHGSSCMAFFLTMGLRRAARGAVFGKAGNRAGLARAIYRHIKGDYIGLLTALDEKVAAC